MPVNPTRSRDTQQDYILGAGVTGLAAGMTSGLPILEAAQHIGGICASYYMTADGERYAEACSPECYRFEIGGGHWIFGGHHDVIHFIDKLSPTKSYRRRSSILFKAENQYVNYPIQENLRCFEPAFRARALIDMLGTSRPWVNNLKDWLTDSFGESLCEKFFYPFHELYTAGLYSQIAPQDTYKSPLTLQRAISGAFCDTDQIGYNTSFIYPQRGLDDLARQMAAGCQIQYQRRVTRIDIQKRKLYFQDKTCLNYRQLISTLPLNRMIELAAVRLPEQADPYTSVLVINLGAVRGEACPEDHWVYLPHSDAGFHRVGFYSNVDSHFLPVSHRKKNDRVSLYVERSFLGGQKPTPNEISRYCAQVVTELQTWGFIKAVEVLDTHWIEVAYTWSYPNSGWKQMALERLRQHDIIQVGRYGRWHFQGIADSIRDGMVMGEYFKSF